jgi:Ca2+-binding RTX toxin-like protein
LNLIEGTDEDDDLFGTERNDRILGFEGRDRLYGRGGNDELVGGDGRDRLWGEAGDDLLRGGRGDDTLTGGSGKDRLTGGSGADRFVLEAETTDLTKADVITDFNGRRGDRFRVPDADATVIRARSDNQILGIVLGSVNDEGRTTLKQRDFGSRDTDIRISL